MKTYLVGGAVRDQLLGLPISERDYVVVGATPQMMIDKGFIPVGSDFPVFLHPNTYEEYALARTERKNGVGYAGFSFHTSINISLEEDLIRRDLTINAMALADDGTLIDPYNGQDDLNNRILRHVSPAFSEDPLRVLRIARFAARFSHLGFTIAPETLVLMQELVNSGEMEHLKPERIWKETERAIMHDHANIYFEVLRLCGALKIIFPEIDALFGVPQRPEHHPEIDCGIHTMMALQQACRVQSNLAVRWAVLLHDLGKGITPFNILPRHIAHESRGVPLVEQLCNRLRVPTELKSLAKIVCEEHLLMHIAFDLKASTLLRLLLKIDVLRKPHRLEEFVEACICDARGRLGFENRDYPQATFMLGAGQIVRKVNVNQLPTGLTGAEIGKALNELRLKALSDYIRQYKLEYPKLSFPDEK